MKKRNCIWCYFVKKYIVNFIIIVKIRWVNFVKKTYLNYIWSNTCTSNTVIKYKYRPFKKGSAYLPRQGVCKKTKTLIQPDNDNQSKSFFQCPAVNVCFFGAHSRNWIACTRTLWKWTGKLCRVKINLYNLNIGLSLTHDNYYRLQHLQKKYDSWNTTKYMWIDNYAYSRPWGAKSAKNTTLAWGQYNNMRTV